MAGFDRLIAGNNSPQRGEGGVGFLFSSRYMPCPQCGGSIERSAEYSHHCNPERLVEYQLFRLRPGIADFEAALHTYLESARGRVEVASAARQVRKDLD